MRALPAVLAILALVVTPAAAAVTTEQRSFTEVTVATELGATTTNALPVAGLIFYITQELVDAVHPGSQQVSTFTVSKLKFGVDPARVSKIVDTGGTRDIAPGESFVVDQTVPYDWAPNFIGFLVGWTVGAHDLGDGRTRVIIPYTVAEGGCAGEGFGTCLAPPGTKFLNGDSDPFDVVIHFAEIIIDRATKTIVSTRNRVNTRISGMAPPVGTNGKIIAFFHSENELDSRCRILSVNEYGIGMSCEGQTSVGTDLNGDGFLGSILTLYDVDTGAVTYTKLSAAFGGFPEGVSGAPPILQMEMFQFVMTGDLLAFRSKDYAPFDGMSCAGMPTPCTPVPPRAGVDYNGDGDYVDTVIRYVSVAALAANPALTPTLGPTVGNRMPGQPESNGGGNLLGTDGRNIFYYLSEAETPVFFLPPMDPNAPIVCGDLNGDCDSSDFVLHALDTQTGVVTNTMSSLRVLPLTVQAGGGFIAIGTDEKSEGDGTFGSFATDFNGDGDTEDTELRVFDATTNTVIVADVTLIDVLPTFQYARYGALPNTDGEIVAYTAMLLNGAVIGEQTLTEIRFVRLPGVGVAPASADLSLAMDASPATVNVNQDVTYTITVTNLGPSAASGVTVTDQLPMASLVSVTLSQGTYVVNGGTLTVNLGALASGATATVSLVVRPSIAGTVDNAASITGAQADPDPANNAAQTRILVRVPDTTLPSVAIIAPADGAVYEVGAPIVASYDCFDLESGIASCAGPVASGASLNTSSAGTFTFTVIAVDGAGNTASLTRTYTVVAPPPPPPPAGGFIGFLEPLSSSAFSGSFKIGRTIPIKWQLPDGHGGFIATAVASTTLKIDSVSCAGQPDGTPPFAPAGSGATALRYDPTRQQYVFNWKTTGLAPGCYSLLVNPGDGVVRTTRVQLTK